MDPKTGEVSTYDPNSTPQTPFTPAEKLDPKKSPQFLAREELAKRREAERRAEITEANAAPYDVLNDDGSITPAKAIEEIPAPDEAAPEAPADAPPVEVEKEAVAPVAEPEPEETRKLVVDGREIDVPISKIIDAGVRTFQKETAADLRLAAASRLEQQARERLQPPQGAEIIPTDDDAALAHAIQFGTEDQAKQAISKLKGRGTNPQEVQQFVQQNLVQFVPEYLKFQDANSWVRSEYKEIFADPMLEQQFMLSENTRRANGDSRPHRDLYKDLAETMVTKFNLRTPKEATPQGAQDRIVKKANSPRPVQAAGGQKAPTPTPRQMTVTDYVEKQRQLRGLAPLPRSNQSI